MKGERQEEEKSRSKKRQQLDIPDSLCYPF